MSGQEPAVHACSMYAVYTMHIYDAFPAFFGHSSHHAAAAALGRLERRAAARHGNSAARSSSGVLQQNGFSLSKKGRGEPSPAPRRSRIRELQTKPGTFRPDARRAPRAGNVTHPGAPSLGGRCARHRCEPLEHGCLCLLLKAPSELSQRVSLVQGILCGQPCAGSPETFMTFPSWLKSNGPERSLQGLGGPQALRTTSPSTSSPLLGGCCCYMP